MGGAKRQKRHARRPQHATRRPGRGYFERLEPRCYLRAGVLDPTFGFAGGVHTDIRWSDDSAEAVAIQADGKIVLAGWAESTLNMDNEIDSGALPRGPFSSGSADRGTAFALARYLPNGSLDSTFGTNGIVRTTFADGDARALAVAIQPDGRIVAAGYALFGSDYDFAVARYLSDGTLDESFSSDGKRTIDFDGGNDIGWGLALQDNGAIVVVGQARILFDDDFAIARLRSDGSLDTSFSGDGKQTTNFSLLTQDIAYKAAIQRDGRIVVVGSSASGSDGNFAVVRYRTNGSLDSSFSSDGKRTISFGSGFDVAQAVAIQSDQMIVVGGRATTGSDFDFALARLDTDGTLDFFFGDDGKAVYDISAGGRDDYIASLLVQPDNRIVATGGAFRSKLNSFGAWYNDLDFATARFRSDGELDPSFGVGGAITTDFGFGHDFGGGVALQEDGKLLVAGASFGWLGMQFAAVRYSNDLPDVLDVKRDNGSRSQSHDLGRLNGVQQVGRDGALRSRDRDPAYLSIHSAADVDWYRLELADAATSGHHVRIDFTHALGDLDIALYDTAGNFLASATGTGNQEEVSLAGYPAGAYFLKVYGFAGATNPRYVLSTSAPWVPEPDVYDLSEELRNDTRGMATNLGSPAGRHEWRHLSLDRAEDIDWFAFGVDAPGTSDFVRIDFTHAVGDLNLFLVDGTGTLIGQSAGSGNREQISLAGLSSGTYYLAVHGRDGATNPDYSLTLDLPGDVEADRFEPNNERRAATFLGTLQGYTVLSAPESNLSIHSSTDEDWYAFRLQEAGRKGYTAALAFDHRWGDLDLELYDSAGARIASSQSAANLEQLSLESLAPDTTYYVRVVGAPREGGRATNPEYALILNAPGDDWAEPNQSAANAFDLRQVRGLQAWGQQNNPLSLDHPQDVDWYRWELMEPGVAGQFARIEFVHALGDLNLSLFTEADFDQPIRESTTTADVEQISLAGLAAGVYYLKVEGFQGAVNPAYSITLQTSGSPVTPGAVTSEMQIGDWSERHAGATDNNSPGNAFPLDGIPGNDVALDPLRALNSFGDAGNGLSIHANDEDWFVFRIAESGSAGHTASIVFNQAEGDLDLELGRFLGGSYTPLARAQGIGNMETVALAGLPATENGLPIDYLLRVHGYQPAWSGGLSATNSQYTLVVNAPGVRSPDFLDRDQPNDTRETSRPVWLEEGRATLQHLSIHSPTDCDWFRFDVAEQGRRGNAVGIQFDPALGNLELALLTNGGTLLERADGLGGNESISLLGRPGGSYQVRVCGSERGGRRATNPDYTLTIDAPHVQPDWAEPNQDNALLGSPQLAYDLRQVDGFQAWSNLSLDQPGDVDYFKFFLTQDGDVRHSVNLLFDPARGDLDLKLVDEFGSGLPGPRGTWRTSDTAFGIERVTLEGLAARDEFGNPIPYFLKVWGAGLAVHPNYTLAIDAPSSLVSDADWAEPNGFASSATDLHRVEGLRTWSGLSIQAGDEDWFVFEMTRTGFEGNSVSLVADRGAQGEHELELTLFRGTSPAAYLIPGTSAPDDEVTYRKRISLGGREAGYYFVRVRGVSRDGGPRTTSPTYSLVINAPQQRHPDILERHAIGRQQLSHNDGLEQAYDLRTIDGALLIPDLTLAPQEGRLADEDWYRIQLQSSTVPGNVVRVNFNSSEGELRLELRDRGGVLIATAPSSAADFREIALNDPRANRTLGAGEYFVRVTGDANVGYSLFVDAPANPRRDWAEQHNTLSDNDSPQQAYELRGLNQFAAPTTRDFELGGFGQSVLGLFIPPGGGVGNLPTIPAPSRDPLGYLQQLATIYNLVKTDPLGVSRSALFRPSTYGIHDPIIEGSDLQFQLGFIGGSAMSTLGYNPTSALNPAAQQIMAANQIGLGPGNFNLNQAASVLNQTANGLGLQSLPYFGSAANALTGLASQFGTPGFGAGVAAPNGGGLVNQVMNFGSQLGVSNLNAYQAGQSAMSFVNSINGLPGGGFGGMGGFPAFGGLTNSLGSFPTSFGGYGGFGGGGWGAGSFGFQPACNPAPWASLTIGNEPPCYASADAVTSTVIAGLSLDKPTDQDWFRFELVEDGQPGHFAGISTDQDSGQLELTLFAARDLEANEWNAAATPILDEARGAGDEERISLAGLPRGAYYLRIRARDLAVNPQYTLMMNLPIRPERDGLEPNNNPFDPSDRLRAYDLRRIEGNQVLTGLSIHAESNRVDTDWFAFQTTASGGAAHEVRIDFDHFRGDLDLELWNNQGTLLAASRLAGNSERISLEGRPAGTYYVRVGGYAGSTNPNYTLTISAPRAFVDPDRLEPNNRASLASRLDLTTGFAQWGGLTIHSGDEDYFRFQMQSDANASHSVSIEFLHAAGDLSLELYDPAQPDRPLAVSTGDGNLERISLAGLPAVDEFGQPIHYVARVFGATSAVHNSYRLLVDAPYRPAAELDDWTILVYMTATNLSTYARADINEMEAAAARLPGTVNFAVLLDQSSAASEQFPTDGFTGDCLTASLGCWGDTRQAIIQADSDRDRITTRFEPIRDAQGQILPDQNTGDPATLERFLKWAVTHAPARRYALILWNHGGGLDGFNYDDADSGPPDHMTIPELKVALAAALPKLNLAHPDGKLDLVAFEQCLMGLAEVEYALAPFAQVVVASEEVTPGDGYDHVQAFSILSQRPDLVDAESLGTAIVQTFVDRSRGRDALGADTHSAVRTSALEELKERLDDFATTVLQTSPIPWPVLREARGAAATFQNRPSYRDLGQFLEHVSRNLPEGDPIRRSAEAAHQALNDAVIARTNDRRRTSGLAVYLPRPAAGASLSSDYRRDFADFAAAREPHRRGWGDFLEAFLNGDSGPSLSLDWSEANDTASLARNLHRLVDRQTFPALSLHAPSDRDWFRFFTATEAGGDVTVTYDPKLAGELALRLYDGQRNLLGQATGSLGTATVLLHGLPEYLLEVWSPSQILIPAYTLTVQAPGGTAEDWVRGNDQPGKPHDLGIVQSDELFSGLAVDSQSTDWYRFATARHYRSIANTAASAAPALDTRTVRLLLPANTEATATLSKFEAMTGLCGEVVSSATGTGEIAIEYASGTGLTYCLSVMNSRTGTVPFSLHFVSPNVDELEETGPRNHPPSAIILTTLGVAEHLAGASIGVLMVEDSDADQSHSLTVHDPRFEIVGNVLRLRDGLFLKREEELGTHVALEITATDSGAPPQSLTNVIAFPLLENPAPWRGTPNPLDADQDGAVAPIDALQLINELNAPTILGAFGKLPEARPASSPLPRFDVNGDGFCTAIDVLLIINHLNGTGEAERATSREDSPQVPWNLDANLARDRVFAGYRVPSRPLLEVDADEENPRCLSESLLEELARGTSSLASPSRDPFD